MGNETTKNQSAKKVMANQPDIVMLNKAEKRAVVIDAEEGTQAAREIPSSQRGNRGVVERQGLSWSSGSQSGGVETDSRNKLLGSRSRGQG